MTYEAYVRLADHEWTFTEDADGGAASDGVTVLSGLTFGWATTKQLWPAQPDVMTASLAINVPNFLDAADLQGETCVIEVKALSAGDPIARFYGDITDARATPRTKRAGVTISVVAVGYTVRAAENGFVVFREMDVGGGVDPIYEHQAAGMLWEQFAANPDDDVTDIWSSPTPRLMYGLVDPFLPPIGTFLDVVPYIEALLNQAIDVDDLTRMIWSPIVESSTGELPASGRVFTLDAVSGDMTSLTETTLPGSCVRLDQLQWSDVKGSVPSTILVTDTRGDGLRKDASVPTAMGQATETIPVLLTGVDAEDNAQAVADFYAAAEFDRWQLDRVTLEVTRAVHDGRLDPTDITSFYFPQWTAPEAGGFRAACYNQLVTITDVDPTRTPDGADTISGVLTGATCRISGGALSLDLILRRPYVAPTPPLSHAEMTLTIPAGTVGSTLTDFPVRLDLADIDDDDWWTVLGDEPGRIRVKDATSTDVPVDIVTVDAAGRTGRVFFLATITHTADAVYTIEVDTANADVAVGATNGRNDLWSDYDFFCDFTELVDRTAGGHDPAIEGVTAGEFGPAVTVASGDAHWTQGVAYDGTNWYSTGGSFGDFNEIRKYNAAFATTVTQSDPIGAAGLTASGANHCGDPCIANVGSGNELFVPVETYPSGPYTNQWVCVYNLSDLSFNRKYAIEDHECSAITFDGTHFWITDFETSGTINRYDTSFNYVDSPALPTPIDSIQGIVYKSSSSQFYIMSGPHAGSSWLWRLPADLSSAVRVWSGSTALEGIELNGNDLYFVSTGGVDHLSKLPYQGTTGDPDWLNLSGSGNALATNLHKRTQWTMGATVRWNAIPTANRGILSYSTNTTTDSARASMLGRSTSKWTIWNSTDTFQDGSTIISGDVGAMRRVHHTQDGTTTRKLYLQGALNATDTGTAQRPSGGTDGTMALFIGAEDASHSERMNGSMNWVYLRNGILTADWLAAETASWHTPSTFYAIT